MKYTIPKISKTTKLWYVHFRYEGKQFRFKLYYNQIQDPKEKQMYFDALASDLLMRLKNGWNPLIKEIIEDKSSLTFIEAFDLALENKKAIVQNDTYIVLKSKTNRFKKTAKDIGLDKVKICDLKNRHFEIILNKTSEVYKLSDTSYNVYKVALSNILNNLVDNNILKRNFKLKIKSKKVIKNQSHIPAKQNQIELIKTHLQANFENFYLFWVTLFHSGMRPTELLKVRLFMINLSEHSIVLNKDITKNGKQRIVPINRYLELILLRLNFDSLPKEYFLFGTDNKKFKAKKSHSYIPAPYEIKRQEATTFWREEIRDKLNIPMTLYAIKKHSANSLILAGVSVNAIKDLFGHTSEMTTQIYITNLKEVNRKEILEKGTDL